MAHEGADAEIEVQLLGGGEEAAPAPQSVEAELEAQLLDVNQKKLEAENAIGVLATLIAGFALSLLPQLEVFSGKIRSGEAGSCSTCGSLPPAAHARMLLACEYVHVMSLVVVACASCFSVVVVTLIYFLGSKILAKRKGARAKMLAEFDAFWDGIKGVRTFSRDAFLASIPLFLLSIAASPKLWCNNCFLAGFSATALASSGIGVFFLTRHLKRVAKN